MKETLTVEKVRALLEKACRINQYFIGEYNAKNKIGVVLENDMLIWTSHMAVYDKDRQILDGLPVYGQRFELTEAVLLDIRERALDQLDWLRKVASRERIDISPLSMFLKCLDQKMGSQLNTERVYDDKQVARLIAGIREEALAFFLD